MGRRQLVPLAEVSPQLPSGRPRRSSGERCDKLRSVAGGGAEGGSPSIVGDLFKPDFEGEITMKMTAASTKANAGASSILIGIKKPKYRMDMTTTAGSAPAGSMILDLPTKKGWLLMHPQKMAMELDLEKMKNGGGFPGLPGTPKSVPTAAPKTPPKIEKTGKKETIAGYTCDVWNITSEGKRSEVCMADGLSWIDMSDLGMGSPEASRSASSPSMRKAARRCAWRPRRSIRRRCSRRPSLLPPDYQRLPMGGMPAIPTFPTKR